MSQTWHVQPGLGSHRAQTRVHVYSRYDYVINYRVSVDHCDQRYSSLNLTLTKMSQLQRQLRLSISIALCQSTASACQPVTILVLICFEASIESPGAIASLTKRTKYCLSNTNLTSIEVKLLQFVPQLWNGRLQFDFTIQNETTNGYQSGTLNPPDASPKLWQLPSESLATSRTDRYWVVESNVRHQINLWFQLEIELIQFGLVI